MKQKGKQKILKRPGEFPAGQKEIYEMKNTNLNKSMNNLNDES